MSAWDLYGRVLGLLTEDEDLLHWACGGRDLCHGFFCWRGEGD